MKKETIKRIISSPAVWGLSGARRGALMLLATLLFTLTAQTALAGDVLYAEVSDTNDDGVNETMTLKCADAAPSGTTRYTGYSSWSTSFRDNITTVNIDGSCAEYTGTTLKGLFISFKNVTAISGLANLRTDDVTDMSSMFDGCSSLTKLDISTWNTANVTTMRSMFMSCSNLTMLNLSTWNTGSVTNMYVMFSGCSNLTLLDLAGWNTGSVTEMQEMFINCSSLQTIIVGSGWTTAAVTSSSYMFYNCTALVGGKGTAFSASYDDKTRAVVDGLNSQPGYLTGDWSVYNTGDDANHAYVISNELMFSILAHRVNAGTTYAGKYFELGADLTYDKNNENNFTPIGYDDPDYEFKGHFDGKEHTISGIRINRNGNTDADKNQGIFGRTGSTADIRNLTLTDTRIIGYDRTGGIVGSNDGTITNCHVTSSVYILSARDYTSIHGGIAGRNNEHGTVSGCISEATVSNEGHSHCGQYGSIVGFNNGGTIQNSLVYGGTVSGNSEVGAIVGENGNDGTLTNNYYMSCTVAGVPNATNVGCNGADTNGARKALAIGAAADVTVTPVGAETTYSVSNITVYADNSGMSYGGNWYAGATEAVKTSISYSVPEGYDFRGFTDGNDNALTKNNDGSYTLTMTTAAATVTPDQTDVWGVTAGRDGSTAEKAYVITTTAGLDLLAKKVNGNGYDANTYSGTYFELGDDIDYSEVALTLDGNQSNYTAIGTYTTSSDNQPFCGKFDGKGHTVSGIRINKDASFQGIFGYISGAEIKNLTITDATISIGYHTGAGGIAGYSVSSTIENCHATSDVIVTAPTDGDLGRMIGGIVGYNGGTVSGCTSAATVSGKYYVGAIAGDNQTSSSIIENCLVLDANVSSPLVAGAIAGRSGENATLTNNRYTSVTKVNGGTAIGHGIGNKKDQYIDTDDACLAVSSTTKPAAITSDATATYGTGSYTGITAYGTNGLYYKGHYYWHEDLSSLELDNSANNSSIIYENSGSRFNVILSGRTLYKDGKWNTICLPFDVDLTDPACPLYGATVMELNVADNWAMVDSEWQIDNVNGTTQTGLVDGTLNLFFKETTSITAGTPYIIKWASGENITDPVFTGVTIDNTNRDVDFTGGSFKGTYARMSWDTQNKSILFVGDNNNLHWPEEGAGLGACRAYFELADGQHAREFVLNFGEGEKTEIVEIDNGQLTIDNSWYDLNGRKLNGKPTKKGLYIVNGRKVVIK